MGKADMIRNWVLSTLSLFPICEAIICGLFDIADQTIQELFVSAITVAD
jgi:hypothetical protein